MNKLQKFGAKLFGIRLEEKASYSLGSSYQIINGQLTIISDNKTNYVNKGYGNDIIYSIGNLIADKVRVVPHYMYRVKDESSLKLLNGMLRRKDLSGHDLKKIQDLRHKALERITSYNLQEGKLKELLEWPNETETYSDFVANEALFKMITGDSYRWADLLNAGANKGVPNSWWLLPSQDISIKSNGTQFPFREVGYTYQATQQNYLREEVMHVKYWNPNVAISGNGLYGVSPLKSALTRINRNNSAQEASAAKFQNNGLEAIVYIDDPKMPVQQAAEQAKALKSAYINELSGPKNLGKITTSGYKVGVANLGLSPVELGIIESEKWDALMFCNIYGVPPELLGLTAKTYNNMMEAEKALTTRSAIPLITSIEANTNRKLQTDWGFKGKNIYVAADLSVYTELEQNKKEIVDWTNGVIGITGNEQREYLGMAAIDIPEMNEVMIDTSKRKQLGELQMNEVDIALSE